MRGFPPAPGAPDPVYPPGQFSPWNFPALRSAGPAGRPGSGSSPNPDASGPGYSQLAVSDPSADATATQTWAVLDAAQLGEGWTAATAADGPKAAAGAGAGLAQDGAPWEQDQSDPWLRARDASDSGGYETGPWSVPDADATGGFPADTGGFPADTGGFPADTGGFPADTGGFPADTGGFPADTGGFPVDSGGNRAGTRVSRAAARGRKPRKPPSRARVWLLPVLMALAVAALITVAYMHFVRAQPGGGRAAAPLRTAAVSSSPTPTLGPWKHITTRSEDSAPLTLTELFPAKFTSGGTVGGLTIDKAGTDCPAAVLGAGLQAAVHKAGCTQVLRASYLTTDEKIMGTIGVLNLVDATSAQRAGQATGSAEFIDQLPATHGPTHSLTKGTGLEEAVYKGHYLILIWAEFATLKAPTTATQRADLKTFCDNLVSGTANVSLTSRMVIGKPQAP